MKTLSRIQQNHPYYNRRDQQRKSTRPRKSTFQPSRSQTVVPRQVRKARGISYHLGEDRYHSPVSIFSDQSYHLAFHVLLVTVNPVIILLVGPT
ncbi:hypothetical protein DPMN_186140 [Dreissena polymorpha]|uniref:Uncharacterized protein n=1 Tax=Dreissena polymorpha TaxID=45954 RepID=A0A9D4DM65_DREPO|nr:hypothetical protein DPMN_186140 [Dreissena polymorpha]